MKIVSIVLILFAVLIIIYNFTLLDFSNPFEGDSMVAVIGILAALCAIALMVVLILSRKVQQQIKDKTNV